MFGEDAASELNKIPLSDNTISRHIQDMTGDIECNIKSKILKHKLFALQVDESTDITGKAQLLVFVRFINDEAIVEDFLCCKELPETRKGQNVFDVLNSYLEYCRLNWKNCVGICTDGAPAMTGCLKGFVPIAQKQNPNIIHTHCFIHREALVAKTLEPELKSVMDMVVKIANYIKMRPIKCQQFAKLCVGMEADISTLIQHTEIRWVSRGKVLSCFYELREELLTFSLQENLKDFVECLSDDHWCSKLAYLANIFHKLNPLNNGMQGRNENILSSTDKINAFQKKLTIWKKCIGNLEMFPSVFKRNCQEIALLILNHLHTLLTNLDKYFPSISVDLYDWIRNPFVEFEPFEEQFTLTEEELANVLNDRTLKLKHSELNLNAFWLLVEKEYPAIAQKALRLLVQFSTSYLCEFGFSALTTIKHKKRAQLLSVEDELRVCLSKTRPNLKELCKKHQAQVSH
ncbi:zinc finger BED domain-containing protein 5 [Octopus bimaculoides]|nr:zinc finger BED domain-containing protein 5 [Octopus bimaculoides]|eukprot:XP_014782252.1 PREDICTED: zinc finger BED domain-containing protein 5-like [Octopus bimaculoides]